MEKQLQTLEQQRDYIRSISEKAERRFVITPTKIEVRTSADGVKTYRGYAAKFNSWSDDLGGFREIINQGFFDKVLTGMDVRMLFNHDVNYVLGRSVSATMRYGQDDIGLWFEYDDPATTWSRDLGITIARNDVNQCSFGFIVSEEGQVWRETPTGFERTLLAGGCTELFDLSVVTFPAYRDTSVAGRSLTAIKSRLAEEERSKKEADRKAAEQILADKAYMDNAIQKEAIMKLAR